MAKCLFELISRRSVVEAQADTNGAFSSTALTEVAVSNLVLMETFNEGVKNHVTLTFRIDSVIEEYGADYSIS
jgi:hypothetical protein